MSSPVEEALQLDVVGRDQADVFSAAEVAGSTWRGRSRASGEPVEVDVLHAQVILGQTEDVAVPDFEDL